MPESVEYMVSNGLGAHTAAPVRTLKGLAKRGNESVEDKVVNLRAGESEVASNKDLLELERSTSKLEKRLSVCPNGENLLNARWSKKSEPPTMGPMPESTVLERLKSFLPTLVQANHKLFSDIQARGAEEFNIEAVSEAEERYVEMDLALGVADLCTPEAVAAAELVSNGQMMKVTQFGGSCESSSDSDFEDDKDFSRNEAGGLLFMGSRGTRILFGSDPMECLKDKSHVKRKKIEFL